MSENSLIALDFEGKQVRMVGTSEKPEWVAADVCKVLGISRPAYVLRYFPTSDKGVCLLDTSGGPQELLTVTEPGLYRLIFKSRKAEAERFKEFVCNEVLPSIRQHGCYPPPTVSANERALIVPAPHEFMMQLGETFRKAVFDTTEPRFNSLEQKVDDGFATLDERISNIERRRNLTEKTKRQHASILIRYSHGMCPCCKETQIITEGGTRLDTLQFDHWHRPSMNDVTQTWPVCESCNQTLKNHDWKKTRAAYFEAYQQDRKRWFEFMDGPTLFNEAEL